MFGMTPPIAIEAADKILPPLRPEAIYDPKAHAAEIGEVKRLLSRWELIGNMTWVRRAAILILLGVSWQVYATWVDNPLIFPKVTETLMALTHMSSVIMVRCLVSLKVLLAGYVIGVALAAVLTTFAISTRFGADLLSTLTAMFNPLPAIGLLPLALLWFGLGNGSLVFVLVHSVLWSVSLNTLSGFLAVPDTLRMAGNNFGLKGIRYVTQILVPAAFPSILTGLKIGWAFAWRTLIAAELVYGTSSGTGGLGWFIYENRNALEVPNVFAGLLTVILIGLFVESVIFRTVEKHTVEKWGMRR
jgi:NitT/TauT family transport system permease protein